MQAPAPTMAGADAALFERMVSEALDGTAHLLEQVLESSRHALQKLEDQARTPGERHSLLESRQQLTRLCSIMASRYPAALRQALSQDTLERNKTTRSLFTVQFDELELMDEHQIHASVERARVRELLAEAVDAQLAELNGLVSAAQGLPSVQPERNPLRPEIFLQALQTVVGQMQVADAVRHDWMLPMAQALGVELRAVYARTTQQLQQAGIKPMGFAIRQADGRHAYVSADASSGHSSPGFAAEPVHSHGIGTAPPAMLEPTLPAAVGAMPPPSAPQPPPRADDTLLTLERLRRLLLGELDAEGSRSRLERFGQAFSDTFESPGSGMDALPPADFDVTVPAAFEALQEMKQVDRLMERLGQQHPPSGHPAHLGRALGRQVVSLMVDNLAQDARLLAPVQEVVRALEPALMRLAMDDPRFFSDAEHPARRLLQEITDRSLGFDSVQATGFESFLLALNECTEALSHPEGDAKEGFETVLGQLHERWAVQAQERQREHDRAVQSLWHAEQRHLLASRIARQIQHMPAFNRVPAEIGAFLLGPWSQVLAQARLNNTEKHPDPGRYRELVDALLWSAQPDQTRKNPAQLARLVPKLLDRLRHGLLTIGYPEAELRMFLDLLMRLHQQALQGGTLPAKTAAPVAAAPSPPPPVTAPARRAVVLPIEDEPWVAPSEAKDSGFMEADALAMATARPGQPGPLPAPTPAALPSLVVGTWVNLRVGEQWERTQLTWAGPHGTLFLFTSANGRSQSMTKRLLERLLEQGALRVVSGQPMVGEALDAVARAAMRNSVDSRF